MGAVAEIEHHQIQGVGILSLVIEYDVGDGTLLPCLAVQMDQLA